MIRDSSKPMVRILMIVLVVALIGFAIVGIIKSQQTTITSFDECVEAGNPVMESYPERCYAEGKSFTRETEE